jgi:lysophospholipase L1-like esterase
MRGGQTRTGVHWSRGILATLVIVVVSALVAEFCARTFFGLETMQYRRPYAPIFVSGDYHYLMPNEQLAFVPEGPVALGYEPNGPSFEYDPTTKPPRTAATFADYLFGHKMSRYHADEVDKITCDEPGGTLVYVLGGSVAQGFSADSKEDTWHAWLERLLRGELGRKDLYVFNAAMGAFVSLQEKLSYYLAVVPRRADMVLIVDGYNDITIPANSSVRPGDPFQMGLRFSQLFSDGFVWWLAKHSAIVHTILENRLNAHVAETRRKLEQDDTLFKQHAEAIADIYVENMTEVLDMCAVRGQSCLVGIQPARSLTAQYIGAHADDILSQKRIVELYQTLFAKIAASPRHDRFFDLTHVFDGGDRLKYYVDSVHPNTAGEKVLAEAVLPHVLEALKSARPVPATWAERCRRVP